MSVNLAQWRRLVRRFLTSAGNVIALPVTATTTTVTWAFPRTEVDAAYAAVATPSWGTTVAVTAKTTTSLTLSFGTAAPSGATVDIQTFRSE